MPAGLPIPGVAGLRGGLKNPTSGAARRGARRGCLALVEALVCSAACSAPRDALRPTPPPHAPAARAARSTQVVPRVLRPRGEPAASYGLRSPWVPWGATGELARALDEAARDAAVAPVPVDREAAGSAHEVCRGLPAQGPPAAGLLEFALRAHGLIEPPPDVVIVDWPAAQPAAAAAALRGRLGELLGRSPYRRAGLALCRPLREPARPRAVVLLLESAVAVEPIPRAIALGQRVRLRFSRPDLGSALELTVSSPQGRVHSVPLRPREGGYEGFVACAQRGRYRIEVTGEGPHGDEVLANFPLDCAGQPLDAFELPHDAARSTRTPGDGASTEQLEAELWRLTNALRQEAGAAALAREARLAGVARQHAQAMLQQDYVGHVDPRLGGPAARLRRAGLACAVVRENVARGYAIDEILRELADSPAHRRNLLADDVTALGSGVAIDTRTQPAVLFVAQLFAGGPCTAGVAAAR